MQEKDQNLTRSWFVVMTAAAFFFYSFIQMTLFSTQEMKAYFSETLSIQDPATFGVFAGMFLNACVIFLLPVGILLDKISVKKMIMATLTLSTVTVFGLAYVKNLQLAMALRFLTGIAHCVAFIAPLRLAPRWFSSRRLALATGLLITFAVSGGLVSQTPMYWCITKFGGQQTMIFNGLLGVVIFVLVALFVKDRPYNEIAKGDATSSSDVLSLGKGLKIAITNKQNWLAGLYIGLLNLSVLLLGAIWGTNYLKIIGPGLSSKIITSIIGMIFIGTMIGCPLCGWISDKVKTRKRSMFAGALISLVIMLIIMYMPNPGTGMLYVLFLLLGIVTAAQTIGYPVIAESNDDNVLGTANGFGAVLIMGMAAIAQPLFGKLINMFGGETAESYKQAIYLMPISFMIALLCTLILRETFKK
jgi:MFS family permease